MQRTILKCIKNGICINFERFKHRTAETILREYRETFSPYQFKGYFFQSYHNADVIRIISTPDGYTEEKVLLELTPGEFFKRITRQEEGVA